MACSKSAVCIWSQDFILIMGLARKKQIKVEIYVSDSAQFIKMNQRKKSQGSHRSHQGQLCQVTAAVLIQLVQYKRPSEV